MNLHTYNKKRDFRSSPEPSGKSARRARSAARAKPIFVVQKHTASRLHYDFRLECDGVLKSWAVPKGPSLDPSEKSLAVEVEDHPLEYADFEGVIPEGNYGSGSVMVWDQGDWICEGEAAASLKKGKLSFRLNGNRLQGHWTLVRMTGSNRNNEKNNWLLIKKADKYAKPDSGYDLLDSADTSVLSGRSMQQIADDRDRVWRPNGPASGSTTKESSPQPEDKAIDPASIEGARKSKLPEVFKPQLATLVPDVPRGADWLHELKLDGYRILAHCDKRVKLITRQGEDWTARFPTIARALEKLKLEATILDGEVVVLDKQGVSDFQALQNVIRRGDHKLVRYYVFDVPYFRGYDLTQSTQLDRKRAVRHLLKSASDGSVLRYSDHIHGDGRDVLRHACRHDLEGVVSKRVDAPYVQTRSKSWVKSKCLQRQEFVIGGWTEPSGSRVGFGALLLGYYQDSDLIFCGRVGTGFNRRSLKEIHKQLCGLAAKEPPFANPPTGADVRGVSWVEPRLIGEVEFTEWTDDGMLRHPSFKGLREDKDPESITRETPSESSLRKSNPAMKNGNGASDLRVAGIKITHPQRVVYPDQGITKLELAEYYADIADWILPYVVDRPLSVVRCPQGREEKCFYQKHATDGLPPAVSSVVVKQEDGLANYITIGDVAGLVALVQMGTLEFHPWGARNDKLDRPDLLVFDLDPDKDAQWNAVIGGASELRDRLQNAGLESFVRTTGGKGLHVVVPLVRRQDWSDAKRFARAVAQAMAADSPGRYIATASKTKRQGKVYVDYLRNSRGATAVASYSTRARRDAPIATPLGWHEVTEKLTPGNYNIHTIPRRLNSLKRDPWEEYFQVRQSLTKFAMRIVDGDV